MPTVLVVDDDPDVRVLLEMCLVLEGFDVLTASNGRHALLRLTESHPALILLDLMMPVMDGVEFRREQRAQPRFRDIPVVCLSARHDARETADELGFAAFLSKPFDLETVIAAVREHCPA
jgi:two-component system, chemotaxis family, chemotaxis protein CheY